VNRVLDSLKQELAELEKARDVLEYSFGRCSKTGVHAGLTDVELESFEALTSRFARLSDILIQKIMRYFDVLDLEDQGTVRDRINRAEKTEIPIMSDFRVCRRYKEDAVSL